MARKLVALALVSLAAPSGLHAMYSPALGCFINRDPGLSPGPGGVPMRPDMMRGTIIQRDDLVPTPYAGRGYQDGTSLYRAYYVPNYLDPFGLALPTFKGFENQRYQEHDAVIEELVGSFNGDRQKWCGCTEGQSDKVTPLDPALVKSWIVQETGGNDQTSKDAWEVDPTQVNVPGDWNQYKADVGLTKPSKRNEGDVRTNLTAALKYLCRKGFGKSGQPAANRPDGFFDGWKKAFERYNGRSDMTNNGQTYSQNYADQVFNRANNPGVYYPIELPGPK